MSRASDPARKLLRNGIRPALHRMGWDLRRWPDIAHPHMRALLLKRLGVDLVVDVGANVGQFGQALREFGYDGDIVSFEPMGSAYRELVATSGSDPRWRAVHSAVGAEPGTLEINVAGNSISSSLLPMLDRHASIAPRSTYVATEKVDVARLDVLLPPADLAGRRPFLKIDTQGYESLVLDGAGEVLDHLVGLELELSLVPLYEGQDLLPAFLERLAGHGFRLTEVAPGLSDRRTGETLQVDGIFTRAD